ncbi:MAG: Gfo/Idh/MocA family oxidoreductase [Spirochaetes bacterium]|nr:Gfo/Idh/MocA family oxidoreductase [Spirochaetota bacterium]
MQSENKTMRLGVIGVGHMGKYHVNVIKQLSSAELAGVFDTNKDERTAVAKKYNTTAFKSVEDTLANVDGVIIAVPTKYHFDAALAALKANVHVLVEKPMTPTVDEAKALAAEAKKRSLILQVGHVERFNGAVQELRNVVRAPRLIETRRLSPFNPRIKDVGVVLDLMIHDIDIVLNLVNRPLTHLSAAGTRVFSQHEDVASATLTFDNGCVAVITASRATQEKIRTLAISEEKDYIILNYTTQEMEIHRQSSSESVVKLNDGISYRQESIVERVFTHRENALKLEVEHFVNCARGTAVPLVDVMNDVRTLEITHDILTKIHGGSDGSKRQ